MDHFQEIYAHHADWYEALVAREDYQGNILNILQQIRPLEGLDVVEFGAGTGRLTRLLAPLVRSIHAFDGSAAMLAVAVQKLQDTGLANWSVDVSDNRYLPVPEACADLSVQGWSFGHAVGWYPDRWREEIGAAVSEMERVTKPGGVIVMLETLGTGRETPQAPNQGLADYYAFVENELGFSGTAIRTDYAFESLGEAEQLTRFFFGDEMADEVVRQGWSVLPECTGVWWKIR